MSFYLLFNQINTKHIKKIKTNGYELTKKWVRIYQNAYELTWVRINFDTN